MTSLLEKEIVDKFILFVKKYVFLQHNENK